MAAVSTHRYPESLSREERTFLEAQATQARKNIYRVAGYCMVLSFLVPFAGAWIKAARDVPEAFSLFKYYVGVAYLLLATTGIALFMYLRTLRPLQRDLRSGVKVVEETTVVRKVFVSQNGSYHLYIRSPITDALEVEAALYHYLREGDAINLLYAPHSKLYLGYF